MIKIINNLTILFLFIFLIIHILNKFILHPIPILFNIIIYRIISRIIISYWYFSYLYSILFILIILRGILMVILYFTRLISNEKNKINFNTFSILIFTLNSLIFLYLSNFNNLLFYSYTKYIRNRNTSLKFINNDLFQNIYNIYWYPYNNLTILSILFLLIRLFTIIKLCQIKSSRIRKLSYE